MNKLATAFITLVTPLLALSCQEYIKYNTPTYETVINNYTYTGGYKVTEDNKTIYSDYDIVFKLKEADGFISIVMSNIHFDMKIPYPMDITLDHISESHGAFSKSSIVPSSGGDAQMDYRIKNLTGFFTSSSLNLEFDYGETRFTYIGTLDSDGDVDLDIETEII